MTETTLRSPVLVLTCNRVGHFKNLVQSLGKCVGASETEIYIAIDGPYDPSVKQANDEILRHSESLTGFSNVHILGRSTNVGPNTNLRLAVDEIFRDHDTLILLEDDNIVAMNFLLYMNATLSTFGHNPRCFSVCGYNLPVARPQRCSTDIYCSPLVNAWGIGLFRDRYYRTDLEARKRLSTFFLNPLNLAKVHSLSPPFFSLFVYMFMSQQEFADAIFTAHTLRHGMFNIYPVDTKVMNTGLDGSGIHCANDSRFFLHDEFCNAEKASFALDIDEKVSEHFISHNAQYVRTAFSHKLRRSIYSYLLYVLCLLVGRDTTVRLRNSAKSGLRKLGIRSDSA